MIKKIILFLAVIIAISPFILLPLFYDSIPSQIPVFVDIEGNSVRVMDKHIFSVFRIPMMGIMIQIICITMFSIPLQEKEKNQWLWLSVSLSAALKMSLTSMELPVYEDPYILNILRTVVLITICFAVVSIVCHLYFLYKKYNGKWGTYTSRIPTPLAILLALSFTGYVTLVLLPLIA